MVRSFLQVECSRRHHTPTPVRERKKILERRTAALDLGDADG